jgi:hypothetical protein
VKITGWNISRLRAGYGVAPAALALALATRTGEFGTTVRLRADTTPLLAEAAQAQPDVEALLTRIGERVGEFYAATKNVICIETSTAQAIDFNSSPQGFARTVESELRVEADGGQVPGEAAVLRTVLKVNGRVPRPTDKKDRAGCTDPNPLSAEPLAFLLPAHRSEYQFKRAGTAKDRNQTRWSIDFTSVDRRSNSELIEDPNGHDDCFDWSGHLPSKGRIWVDAENYDVVRIERGLGGPVDVKVPAVIQRRYQLAAWVVIVRDDTTIRYKKISFSNPDEALLLPESIDTLTVVQGGLQSMRRNQRFSDYKRFVTGARVVQ